MTIMKLKTGCDTSLVGGATESLTFFWGSTVLFSVFSSSPLFFFSYHLILHSSSAACPLPRLWYMSNPVTPPNRGPRTRLMF